MANLIGSLGNDNIIGTGDADVISGLAGNDKITGGLGGDVIKAGTNTGTYTYVAQSVTIQYKSSDAAYHNSFGYYILDANGKPSDGKIIWGDIKDIAANLSVKLNVDPSKIGYFIIPNGGNLNPTLGNNVDIHFISTSSGYKAVVDSNNKVLVGQGAPVLFDNAAFNSDGIAHSKTLSGGNLGFEDLVKGGDKDFNDAIFKVTNNPAKLTLNGGDSVWGGNGTSAGDGAKDVFVYETGNKLLTVNDFEKGIDMLRVLGYTAADAKYIAQGADTFVMLSATDGILLKNISLADAQSLITFGANQAPVAQNLSGAGLEDGPAIAISLLGSDADGNVAGYRVSALPANGVLYKDAALTQALGAGEQVASSTLYFKSAVDFSGNVSFNYVAVDNEGQDSNAASVSLSITATNIPPIAVNDLLSFTDVQSGNHAINLLTNDADPEGSALKVVSVQGAPVIGGLNAISVTPVATLNADEVARYELKPQAAYDPLNLGLTAILIIYASGVVHLEANGALAFIPDQQQVIINGLSYTMEDAAHAQSSAELTISIQGQDNNDVILGSNLNDFLNGGLGADVMKGGLGNDTYTVNHVGDVVIEGTGQGNDTILTSVSYTLPNDVESMTAQGSDNINLTGNDNGLNNLVGNAGDNVISGGGGIDFIYGLEGNDTLLGGAGTDGLLPGAGNNIVDGGLGSDAVLYNFEISAVTVDLSIGKAFHGPYTDTLISIEDASGTEFNDTLIGNSENNNLQGLGGSDNFVFDASSAFGNDVVSDFQVGPAPDADILTFKGIFDQDGSGTVDLADLLAVSRVIDVGGTGSRLEVYDANIGPENDPTAHGATLLGSVALPGVPAGGFTELDQVVNAAQVQFA